MFDLLSFDVSVLQAVNLSYHGPVLNAVAGVITCFGWLYFGLVLSGVLYLSGKPRAVSAAKLLFVSLVVTGVVIELTKFCVARPRPYTVVSHLIVLAYESNLSFPSGHTATAATVAYCLSRYYEHTWLFMLLPVAVGVSRLYLGVHYPSDVIAGFMAGVVISYVCERFMRSRNLI